MRIAKPISGSALVKSNSLSFMRNPVPCFWVVGQQHTWQTCKQDFCRTNWRYARNFSFVASCINCSQPHCSMTAVKVFARHGPLKNIFMNKICFLVWYDCQNKSIKVFSLDRKAFFQSKNFINQHDHWKCQLWFSLADESKLSIELLQHDSWPGYNRSGTLRRWNNYTCCQHLT